MKNVSLYIAKKYNANTLWISMLLITLTAFLVSALIYIGNSSAMIIREIIYPKQLLNTGQMLTVYGIMFIYLLVQTAAIYTLFSRFLKTVKQKSKFRIALLISAVSGLGALGILYFNLNQTLVMNIVTLVLISTGLLTLIFAMLSFLLSKRKITGVNIITSIAVFAITIATAALFIILSVFSGLEKMNLQFFSSVNPDIKISAAKGKIIPNIDQITDKLNRNSQVAAFAKVIEEKVSIEFGDKQDIAYIKGIDKNYNKVVRIDTAVLHGDYFKFDTPYEIIASDGVARRLQMYIDSRHSARLRMPKPGKGLITSESEAFTSAVASPIGVSFINEQYDKYIFSPLELTQQLLLLPSTSAYSIEVKLKPNASGNAVKAQLQKELGNSVIVQTRQDIDATFIKVMNVENLIIYLIFTLVIIIASFNLAGAIIIIIIDKKTQIKTMWSFGMPLAHIKRIFFQTGLLITVSSIIIGLLLASTIGYLQNQFSLVMANAVVPFPFEFTVANYLIVILTVLVIGGGVSYMVSRKLPIS